MAIAAGGFDPESLGFDPDALVRILDPPEGDETGPDGTSIPEVRTATASSTA